VPRPDLPEFPRRAVALANQRDENGDLLQPVAKVAEDLGTSDSCRRNWIAQRLGRRPAHCRSGQRDRRPPSRLPCHRGRGAGCPPTGSTLDSRLKPATACQHVGGGRNRLTVGWGTSWASGLSDRGGRRSRTTCAGADCGTRPRSSVEPSPSRVPKSTGDKLTLSPSASIDVGPVVRVRR
jgi:hypothetical protein